MAQYGVTGEAALLSNQLTRFDAPQHAGSSRHDVAGRCGHAAGALILTLALDLDLAPAPTPTLALTLTLALPRPSPKP